MKNAATALFIQAEDRECPGRSDSTGGEYEVLLTPKEAAAYLRVSKSYLDKFRVYGGGPKFLRFGKRKILYPKTELDLWAAKRLFGSTSEYRDDGIYSRDKSEWMSNAKQQRQIIKLGENSS